MNTTPNDEKNEQVRQPQHRIIPPSLALLAQARQNVTRIVYQNMCSTFVSIHAPFSFRTL